MKRIAQICLLLMFVCQPANAADMHLRIETPDMTLLLSPVTPPQAQKEGLPLLGEDPIARGCFNHLENGGYEEVLACLRKEKGNVLELVESGDPEGWLKQHAVVGGIEPVTKIGGVSAYLLYLIGQTYFSLEKYSAAETAFLAALTPIPDYIRVHESLGLLYLRMERYKEAIQHLSHAAELGLHTGQLFSALGYLNYETKNYWGAVNAFQEALMLDPDCEQCKRGLLYSLNMTYQHRSALTLVESMLREKPDDANLWLSRASSALQAGERKEALSSLETAIRLGDRRVSNFQVCATLHMELGSIERAVDLLKTGFAAGMDFSFFDQGMSWLVQAEEWSLLEQMVGSVREKWDDLDDLQQSKVLMREADVSLHKGEKSAAGEALEKAITLDPTNAYALMSLGDLYREKTNYNRAELLYQRASAYGLYRQNALISLARLALDQEDYPRTLRILRDTLKEFPTRTDLNRNIETLENIVLLENGD